MILRPAPTSRPQMDPRRSLWGSRLILQGAPRSRPLPVRGATNELANSNNGAFSAAAHCAHISAPLRRPPPSLTPSQLAQTWLRCR